MATPFYVDDWLTAYEGDARAVLAELPEESVHCVVTSPPYWGLRDYGTATWEGGDEDCDHLKGRLASAKSTLQGYGPTTKVAVGGMPYGETCGKCGARRVDSQLGLEPTPEEYVANMVAVFREVRRVLRADGTVWLNLGDSYAGGAQTGRNDGGRPEKGRGWAEYDIQRTRVERRDGLKPKDLVGIPWRVAFALQADGWYLRSDIIWAKPNPMPESVTDRPAKSHEYVFLLAKSDRYYYDDVAVRGSHNLRDVWRIVSDPYPASHFAVFPEELALFPIRAGTSARGVCSTCGAPWRRTTQRTKTIMRRTNNGHDPVRQRTRISGHMVAAPTVVTTGWAPGCKHQDPVVPAVVLDPFAGTGTTAIVARRYLRRAVVIDLDATYLRDRLVTRAEYETALAR